MAQGNLYAETDFSGSSCSPEPELEGPSRLTSCESALQQMASCSNTCWSRPWTLACNLASSLGLPAPWPVGSFALVSKHTRTKNSAEEDAYHVSPLEIWWDQGGVPYERRPDWGQRGKSGQGLEGPLTAKQDRRVPFYCQWAMWEVKGGKNSPVDAKAHRDTEGRTQSSKPWSRRARCSFPHKED